MRRLVLGLLALAAAVVAANAALERVLSFPWNDPRLDVKLRWWRAHAARFDTLLLGSSLTYRHVSPAVLDRTLAEAGVRSRSFNFGVDGVHLPQTHRLLVEVLAAPDPPRRVIVELARFTSGVDPEIDHTKEAKAWRTPAYTASMVRFLADRHDKGPLQKLAQGVKLAGIQAEAALHVGLGADVHEYALADPRDPRVLGPARDGFYAVDVEALERTGEAFDNAFLADPRAGDRLDALRRRAVEVFESPRTHAPNAEGLRLLRDMLDRAEAAGTRLVFVVPPRQPGRYDQVLPLLAHLPAGSSTAELADPRRHPDFYRLDESVDLVHFDLQGARRYSRALARELAPLLTASPLAASPVQEPGAVAARRSPPAGR